MPRGHPKRGRVRPLDYPDPSPAGSVVGLPGGSAITPVLRQRKPLTFKEQALMCPDCGGQSKIRFGQEGKDKRFRCTDCSRCYKRTEATDGGERVEAEGEGLLRAMRFVLSNGPWHDRSGEEKSCRAWLVKERRAFLLKKHELEREEKADSSMGGFNGPDVSSAKVREAIRRLIEEFDEAELLRAGAAGVAAESGVS